MQSISTGYGRVTFESASARYAAFLITEPWVRTFPNRVLTRRGRAQSFPATQYPDINGNMMLDTMEANDGHVLLLQAQYTSFGKPVRDAAVFINLREQGPMLTVNAKVPVSRDSLLGDSFLIFQGRGDLLGLDDLKELKIEPQRVWVDAFMQADEIEGSLTIHELQAEVAPRPKVEVVTNLSGKEVALTVTSPSRRIRIR